MGLREWEFLTVPYLTGYFGTVSAPDLLQRRIPNRTLILQNSHLPYLPYLPYVRTSLTYLSCGTLAPTVSSPSKAFHPQPKYLTLLTLLNVTPAVPTTHTHTHTQTHTHLVRPSTLLSSISPHPPPRPPTNITQHFSQLESYTPLRQSTPQHPPNHNAFTQPLQRGFTTHPGYSGSLRGRISNVSLSFATRSHNLGPIVSTSHRQSDIPCHLVFNITADIPCGTR